MNRTKKIREKDENTEMLDNFSSFPAEQCSEELKLSSNYEVVPCPKANDPIKVTHFYANWIGKDADDELAKKFAWGKLYWRIKFKNAHEITGLMC